MLDANASLLSNVYDRWDIAGICDKLGFLVGVELGVREGDFARNNLKTWPNCVKYYVVDIWGQQVYLVHYVSHGVVIKFSWQANYVDTANRETFEQEKVYQRARSTLAPHGDKVIFVRNYTTLAATLVPDASVDFVYVDARHDYCGCKEDIEMWWPKLRHGGLMAGHDYLNATEQRQLNPKDDWSLCEDGVVNEGAVKAAVNEFASKNNLKVYTTLHDGPWVSWMYSRKELPRKTKSRHHNNTSSLRHHHHGDAVSHGEATIVQRLSKAV